MARKSKYGPKVTGAEQYVPEENPRLDRLREIRLGPNEKPFPPEYGEGMRRKLANDEQQMYMQCVKEAENLKGGYLTTDEQREVRQLVQNGMKSGKTMQMLEEMEDRMRRGLPTESPFKKLPSSRRDPPGHQHYEYVTDFGEFKFDAEQLRKLSEIPNLKRAIGGSFPVEVKYDEPVDDGLTVEQREILAGMEG